MPLRQYLVGHSVDTAFERGWAVVRNGELLDRAESEGYEVLITTDQNLRHQQSLTGRKLAILVLRSTSWPRIRPIVDRIRSEIEQLRPGDYLEVPV